MSVFTADTCVVCLDADSQEVLLHCRHRCLCGSCADEVQAAGMPCPLCRGVIAGRSRLEEQSLPPTEAELTEFDRDEYVRRLGIHHRKNAGFVGRSKQARAVARHVGNEMEERIRQNAGTDRFAARDATFAFSAEENTFTVTYKVKRKPIVETYPMLESAEAVAAAIADSDPLDLCTNYPELWWLAKHFKVPLSEKRRRRG